MSTIRKQSLYSSAIVYTGFAMGFGIQYLFIRDGGFTKEQYGLTSSFISFANVLFMVASFGSLSYITKFFPYYRKHTQPKENDLFTWSLLFPMLGFVLVTILGILFKGPLINHVFSNSPELLQYYYWLFPFTFGYTLFMVLEAHAWFHGKSVLSNFFKEVLFRIFLVVLIVLTTFGIVGSFNRFIHIYSFIYVVLALLLLVVLQRRGVVHFTLKRSRVTRRFFTKIRALVTYTWSSTIIFTLASVFDKIVIAAVLPNGMAMVGIYSFGEMLGSIIQAPQRAIVSAAVSHLSTAWRDKDLGRIGRIYQRSAINQLVFAVAMFSLIWLNFEDALRTFHIQKDFSAAFSIFFILGLTRIIDMGTGLSSQIIATSTAWRFEFTCGMVLLALSLPLNYFFAKNFGLYGPPVAGLISYAIFNVIRYVFLWRRFGMQPFTVKTLYTLLLAAGCFLLAWYPARGHFGLGWIALRTVLFGGVFFAGMLALNISPDVLPVWATIKKRLGLAAKGE